MAQQPSIGRIVHFCDGEGMLSPAVIVKVFSETCVSLAVLHQGGHMLWPSSVVQGNELTKMSWFWPPRV